jgi:arylsulfatase A-like enzyme
VMIIRNLWGKGGMIGAAAAFIASAILVALVGCNRDKKPNVILVIVDTLPAGHVGCYGYERSITPTIDALAQEGVRFERDVATAPWTLPSIASILTGALPSRHRAGIHLDPPTQSDRRLTPLRPDITTLAGLFKEHKYQTVGFFNNPFVHPETGLASGFDDYNYADGDNLQIRPAPAVVMEAMAWLGQKGNKPFLMVVHLFDPHLAYSPPLGYVAPYIQDYKGPLSIPFNPVLEDIRSGKVTYTDEDKNYIRALYDGEVAQTDAAIGNLFAFLKSKGLYDSALIIVTADHGEEFWQHGGFEHGHSLHREVIEVPLIMKYPGRDAAGTVVKELVSNCDILPTIAEFMTWPIAFPIDGVSLLPHAGAVRVLPHNIVSENVHYGPQQQCLYAQNKKLIVNTDTGEITVYDLEKDPAETTNIFGSEKLPDKIKAQVQKIAKDLKDATDKGPGQAIEFDAKTIQSLKSMGYFTNVPTPPSKPEEKKGDTTKK